MGKTKLNKQEIIHELKKRHYESDLLSAVREDTIAKIVPRLHKINISSRIYNYHDINRGLGPLYEDPHNNWMKNKKDIKKQLYDKKYIRKFPNFNISVFVNPLKPGMHRCYISISPTNDIETSTHKDFLSFLDHSLPNLETSKVEYALDFLCTDVITLENFTDMVRRHLYVPYQRKVITYGGDFEKIGKSYSMNLVTHFGDDHKAYERGKDCDKKGKGWEVADINRLRFEFTATKSELKKNNIIILRNLIENPKFFAINSDKWKFQKFKEGSKKLPSPHEPFNAVDDGGFTGAFQSEYIRARKEKIVKNLATSRKEVVEFSTLRSEMNAAMQEFDEKWKAMI